MVFYSMISVGSVWFRRFVLCSVLRWVCFGLVLVSVVLVHIILHQVIVFLSFSVDRTYSTLNRNNLDDGIIE